MRRTLIAIALPLLMTAAGAGLAQPGEEAPAKTTFHQDAGRSGWNPRERILTPTSVAGGAFGPVWQSPQLDRFGDVAPRLFASPLYLPAVDVTKGPQAGKRFAVAFVATSTGYAYAISAKQVGGIAPGTILWRARLADKPCDEGTAGVLATPVIDRAARRLYVTSCDDDRKWRLHALDLGSGQPITGWPIALDAAAINAAGNRNGANRFTDARTIIQRGALALSADGKRLYVAIGPDSTGWLVSVDTVAAKVASAFSSTATSDEDQGGMWAAAGPSIDRQGRIHIATGSKFLARARKGVAGIFPDSANDWGQSVLQFRDDPTAGLTLLATYSPFNYCTAGANDIDLGASGTVAIDLPAGGSTTPALLALGGKQGNFYLLDRDRLPGDTVKRHPCSTDPDSDGSLLAPEPQPHLGLRGPINLFGPYSDYVSMLDQAKSRSTPASYVAAGSTTFVFATGSAKSGEDFAVSAPPGLARLRIVTTPGQPAYPKLDGLEKTQTFQNPGSPVVSSTGGTGAIVWVLDTNAPRSASLYGDRAPRPILYAFDALTLRLLWKNTPGVLCPGGKYNEPSIVDGMVLVGTDRLQAFGLRAGGDRVSRAVPSPAAKPKATVTKLISVPSAAIGRQIFQARCASCHTSRQPGTPSRDDLGRMPRSRVETALTSGIMRPMASGMSRSDIAAVALYLSGGK